MRNLLKIWQFKWAAQGWLLCHNTGRLSPKSHIPDISGSLFLIGLLFSFTRPSNTRIPQLNCYSNQERNQPLIRRGRSQYFLQASQGRQRSRAHIPHLQHCQHDSMEMSAEPLLTTKSPTLTDFQMLTFMSSKEFLI